MLNLHDWCRAYYSVDSTGHASTQITEELMSGLKFPYPADLSHGDESQTAEECMYGLKLRYPADISTTGQYRASRVYVWS